MAEMQVGRPLRLRAVRFKDGREIRVMRSTDDGNAEIKRRVSQAVDALSEPVVGVALVAWSENNGSVAHVYVGDDSRIPFILVPDFVRNRLLANAIEKWTIDTLDERGS